MLAVPSLSLVRLVLVLNRRRYQKRWEFRLKRKCLVKTKDDATTIEHAAKKEVEKAARGEGAQIWTLIDAFVE